MKIFRQMRQNFARVVGATRRNFVKYDGKDSADSSASEFLEVPLYHILPIIAIAGGILRGSLKCIAFGDCK